MTSSPSRWTGTAAWYGRICAPRCLAPRASAQTVFQASIEPSGTLNARVIPGCRRGSYSNAACGAISSQSTPVARQPAAKRSA